MPSIFIWKSDTPLLSSSILTYYIGSNWFLEENKEQTQSYIYQEQYKEVDSSYICFHATKMPYDWVGSDILEVIQVPYQLIKEDSYGVLEQLGSWMRLILKKDIIFDEEYIKQEWNLIQSWIQLPISKKSTASSSSLSTCVITSSKPYTNISLKKPNIYNHSKQSYNNHSNYYKKHTYL
jgi:hypothetical protein